MGHLHSYASSCLRWLIAGMLVLSLSASVCAMEKPNKKLSKSRPDSSSNNKQFLQKTNSSDNSDSDDDEGRQSNWQQECKPAPIPWEVFSAKNLFQYYTKKSLFDLQKWYSLASAFALGASSHYLYVNRKNPLETLPGYLLKTANDNKTATSIAAGVVLIYGYLQYRNYSIWYKKNPQFAQSWFLKRWGLWALGQQQPKQKKKTNDSLEKVKKTTISTREHKTKK